MNITAPSHTVPPTQPVKSDFVGMFDVKRPGFLRIDDTGYASGDRPAGMTGVYAGLNDAIDAATQVVASGRGSVVVLNEGSQYGLRHLEAMFKTAGIGGWDWRPVSDIPTIEARDTFENVNGALEAIVTESGVIDRARITAPAG